MQYKFEYASKATLVKRIVRKYGFKYKTYYESYLYDST